MGIMASPASVAVVSLVAFLAKAPAGSKAIDFVTLLSITIPSTLVGVTLIADGIGFHIPRGYLYFAIAFSAFVEFLNLQATKRRRRKASLPVQAAD